MMGCIPISRRSCIGCTLVHLVFISLLILWITLEITSASSIKFHVTDASLTHFNLTSNNTLYYKFKVNISVRNPNKNVEVDYRSIRAIAWYKDNDFGWVNLTPFYQGHKNTTLLESIAFEGNSTIKLKSHQLAEYNEETRVGIYNDLAVDLDLVIRAKYGRNYYGKFFRSIVRCRRLRVPSISSAPPFNVTNCNTVSLI